MASIRIGVITPSKEERIWLDVPNDIPANQLVIAIQHALGLPTGRQYHLELRSQELQKRFDHNLSLERNGILNNQEFHLVQVSKPLTSFRQMQQSDRIRIGLAISSPWVDEVRYETIRVDPRLPLWEIISTVDQALSLPSMDADGNALAYHFEFPLGRQLPMTASLWEQGIGDDTVLDLVGEPVEITQFRNVWRETFNQDPPSLPLENLKTREALKQIGTIIEIMASSGITGDASQYYVRNDDMYNILTSYLENGIREGEWSKINQFFRTVTRAREEERSQILSARPEKLLAKSTYSFLSSPETVPTQKTSQNVQASSSWDEGKFIITAQVPETVVQEKVFQVEIFISVKLELLHWLTVENKTPMNFDITLFAPALLILGPKGRQVSLPMMPGEHQIHTSLPAMCKVPGETFINLQFFQRGRYIGELELGTTAQAEVEEQIRRKSIKRQG